MNQNRVCAVIVSYNIGAGIRRCFDSVADQVEKVVIVDNGSSSDTVGELRKLELRPLAKVIYNEDNLGIAKALNQGVDYAIRRGHRWVLTLDDDSEATPGMVEKLLEGFGAAGPEVGIVAANPFDLNTQTLSLPDKPGNAPGTLTELRMVISSGSLISARTFERVGTFDEGLFLAYVDQDFCARIAQKNLKIFCRPDAVLLHREGAKEFRSFFGKRIGYNRYGKEARYFITRNAIHILRRYPHEDFSRDIVSRWVRDFAKIILYDEERVAKARFILKGLLDGMRGKYGGLTRPVARPRVT